METYDAKHKRIAGVLEVLGYEHSIAVHLAHIILGRIVPNSLP